MMTVNKLLSEIQKLKDQGKIEGSTEILTYDAWKNERFEVSGLEAEDDGSLMLV